MSLAEAVATHTAADDTGCPLCRRSDLEWEEIIVDLPSRRRIFKSHHHCLSEHAPVTVYLVKES